jgi:hypothetical protein
VVCQLVLATQAELEAQPVTLTDFHLVRFAEPRAYSEQELRRLSPAVQQTSSLLAVAPVADGSLQLWGLLFSEHQWDQLVDQPRLSPARPPRAAGAGERPGQPGVLRRRSARAHPAAGPHRGPRLRVLSQSLG